MREKELTDKIREVFDNFEDPAADYGWQELRKKYPENNRIVPIWWWVSVAAILMVAGVWVYLPSPSQQMAETKPGRVDTEVKRPDVPSSETKAPDIVNEAGNHERAEILAGKNDTKQPVENLTTEMLADKNNAKKPTENLTTERLAKSDLTITKPRHTATANNSSMAEPVAAIAPEQMLTNQPLRPINAHSTTGIPQRETLELDYTKVEWAPTTGLVKTPLISLPVLSSNAPAKDSLIRQQGSALAMLEPVANETVAAKQLSTDHKNSNSISVYAGSFFNYAEGSETKMNFGAGFASDFSLDKRFKLTAGLGLAKNTLVYNNGLPVNNSSSRALAQDAFPSSAPVSGNNLTTITRYEANLVNIDIPVNLKYLIIPKAEALYLSAGLSSGILMSEAYSLNYKSFSASSNSYVSQADGGTVKRQFQAFDFARTLNFSLGFNTSLGKSQSLSIEPFVKYPIGGVGSENLRFGTSGLNLKLNFSTHREND